MAERAIRIGRKYPRWRISAYECEVTLSGVSYKLGETDRPKYVWGDYGLFNEYILQKIIRKLDECTRVGKGSYPFLIVQIRLEDKTTARITFPKDVKFDRRKPATGHTWCAVVLSRTEYKLLSPEIT